MTTPSTVTQLRPAAEPAALKKADPTAPIRQRRHRAKVKSATVTSRVVTTPPVQAKKLSEVQAKKQNEVKANVTLPTSKMATRALARQAGAALSVGVVAALLTTLSLSHLAHGITAITGASEWEGWSMAIAIDLGFIVLELCQLAATSEKVRRQVSAFAYPTIIVTLVGSAGMNALAFSGRYFTIPPTVMTVAAVTLGVAIPALIYALTRVGAALAADFHARA